MMSFYSLLARILVILINPWLPCCDYPIKQSSSFRTIQKTTVLTICEVSLHQSVQVYSRPIAFQLCIAVSEYPTQYHCLKETFGLHHTRICDKSSSQMKLREKVH